MMRRTAAASYPAEDRGDAMIKKETGGIGNGARDGEEGQDDRVSLWMGWKGLVLSLAAVAGEELLRRWVRGSRGGGGSGGGRGRRT